MPRRRRRQMCGIAKDPPEQVIEARLSQRALFALSTQVSTQNDVNDLEANTGKALLAFDSFCIEVVIQHNALPRIANRRGKRATDNVELNATSILGCVQ